MNIKEKKSWNNKNEEIKCNNGLYKNKMRTYENIRDLENNKHYGNKYTCLEIEENEKRSRKSGKKKE